MIKSKDLTSILPIGGQCLIGPVAFLTFGASLCAPALAQDVTEGGQLQDIIVTAQKREQSLQKVPVTIAAIEGDSLVSRGISNIEDLGRSVVGTQMTVSSGVVLPFVRGIGNTATTAGNESSVAVYVDGVYYSRLPSGVFQLRNVARVEVLKGPQGTLFGRNASAGLIHVITQDPSHDAALSGSIGYGRFNILEGSLYATAGLSETIAADISISGRNQGRGFGKNVLTGRKTNYFHDFGVRSKLLFEPTDTTRIMLTGLYSYGESTAQGNTAPGTTRGYASAPFVENPRLAYWDQDNDFDSPQKSNLWGATLSVEQETSFAQLKSVTAYLKTVIRNNNDGDYGPRPDFAVFSGGPIKQFTQELQLSSLSGSALEWTLGAFYYNTTNEYDDKTLFFSPSGALTNFGPTGLTAIGKSHAKSYALYGQATYEIVPNLRITGGLRHTWDRTTADGQFRVGGSGALIADLPNSSDKLNKLTYRGAIDFQAAPNILLYGSASRGYKAGVYNLLTYNPVPNKAEVVDAYEIGFKTDLLDRTLRLNGSLFWNDVTNPQVALIQNASVLFSNADGARSRGAELEAQAVFSPALSGRLGIAYTDSKYTAYPNAPSGTTPAFTAVLVPPYGSVAPFRSIDAKGNYQPFAPKWTVNAGFDYELNTSVGDWLASVDAFYNDGYFTEAANFVEVDSFVILNAQLKYMPTEHWGVRFWGKNLLGEKYILRGSAQAGPQGWPFAPSAPTTYGIAIDFSF